MGLCGWCMLLALVIVVPVRYGSSANGTGPPLRNHDESVRYYIPSSPPPYSMRRRRHSLLSTLSYGEIGNVASIGGSWSSSFVASRSLSDKLIRPHRLSLHHLDLFPVHSGHIGDFRGPNGWLAMPLRRQRLPSRSPSLGSRTPLPLLWACRRSNTAYKNVAEFVLSSIGISVGAGRHAAFPSPSRSFSLLCPALASLVPNSAASPGGRNLFVSGTPTISPLHAVSQGCSLGFPHLVAQLVGLHSTRATLEVPLL